MKNSEAVNKESVLKVCSDVGLVDWVDMTGEYFTFTEHEMQTPLLIAFAQAFYDLGRTDEKL